MSERGWFTNGRSTPTRGTCGRSPPPPPPCVGRRPTLWGCPSGLSHPYRRRTQRRPRKTAVSRVRRAPPAAAAAVAPAAPPPPAAAIDMRRRPRRRARRPRSSVPPSRSRWGSRVGPAATQRPRAVTGMAAATSRRPTRGWPIRRATSARREGCGGGDEPAADAQLAYHRRGCLAPRRPAAATGTWAPVVCQARCRRRRPRVTVNVAATAFEWRAPAVTARVAGWRGAIPPTPTVRPVGSVAAGCSAPPPPRRPPVQRVSTATGSGGLHSPRCPRAAVGGGGAACAGILPSCRGYCSRAGGGGARPPPLPAAARKTCQLVTRRPRRRAPATPWPSRTMRGAALARPAAPWRGRGPTRRGAATRAATGRRGSARTRMCRHRIRCCQRRPSHGSCRGSAPRARRAARPAPTGGRGGCPPPPTRRATRRSPLRRRGGLPAAIPTGDAFLPMAGSAPPAHSAARSPRGGTRRVHYPLDGAAYAGLPLPWVNPPATGPPTGRQQRAGGVLPPLPLPTASHAAAEVAAAAMAAVAVVTLVPTAVVEGAAAAIRRPS